MWAIGNYPITYKLKPGYPFNHLMGWTCSGEGVHYSMATEKETAGFLVFLSGLLLYIFWLLYFKIKISHFLKHFSPKGSRAMMNMNFR